MIELTREDDNGQQMEAQPVLVEKEKKKSEIGKIEKSKDKME